jgi:hypothetical protein
MNSRHITEYFFLDSERNCTTNVLCYLKRLDIKLAWFGQHLRSLHQPSFDVVADIRENRDINIIYLTHTNNPNYLSTEISWEDPRIDVIKKALSLMYSRHSNAFDELIQNCESDAPFTENMKLFYGEIIDAVNSQPYVLK